MFSVWELAVIGGVALLVYGPEELPGVIKTASHHINKLRELGAQLTSPSESCEKEDQLKKNQERAKAADKQYPS